jgi:hypothetical protein
MKKQCKTCSKNCDGDYCFQHKPRKQLATSRISVKKSEPSSGFLEMRNFFLQIWNTRQHLSEISGLPLIGEPLSVYFHHIIPKEKYPQAKLDEENIILLTLNEHTNVENDIYKYEEVNKRREYLKTKYDI